ncbi:MAG: hypothetical protein J5968_06130, partial [Oscillospiraceae bacterium]|nr:hypothetical protein [Oscillospiraceae bacterium]
MKTANHIVHVRKAIVHAKAIVVFSGFDILKMCYAADAAANGVACVSISETGKEDNDMKKRFLSALLASALITALLPITAAAA